MAEVTVGLAADGAAVFRVHFAEPMTVEFGSRAAAERFMAWLRAEGATLDLDGSCQACAAHHATDHDCPSCGASLDLRMRPAAGERRRRPEPLRLPPVAVAVEQHRIRVAKAVEARDRRIAAFAMIDGTLFAEAMG